ncbi:hypothetical protein KC573_00365 [candidate division WWE3 bacterium]|uniref:DAGKc domain-containing protein n=1 Tax=candidate division WWE3 bacterium TaxID=2053526 RepID=A0A955LVB7_UNCKA|nr:hypothetical protein [candidate division WWE3 bacterium]
MKTIPLFINTKSGNYAAFNNNRVYPDSVKLIKLDSITERVDDITQELSIHPKRVLIAGGDGTVSFIAGLLESSVEVGIVPIGTENVLARTFGVPTNPTEAIELGLRSQNLIEVDGLRVDDRVYFLNISAGVSSLVIKDTATEHKQKFGKFAYVFHTIKHIMQPEKYTFDITIDGKEQTLQATEMLVANVKEFGMKRVTVSENIDSNDGKADVYVYVKDSLIPDSRNIETQADKIIVEKELTHVGTGERIQIRSKDSIFFQGDGDEIITTNLDIKVEPSFLTLISP